MLFSFVILAYDLNQLNHASDVIFCKFNRQECVIPLFKKTFTIIFLINNQTHSTNQQIPIKNVRFLRTYSFQAEYEKKIVKSQNLFNKQTLTIYLIGCNNFTYNEFSVVNLLTQQRFANELLVFVRHDTVACARVRGTRLHWH